MTSSISKSALAEQIAAKHNLTQKQAAADVDAVLSMIAENLAEGSEVRLSGFGVFSVADRAARTGRNPTTGESIQVAASKNVKFKAGKDLKDKL